MYDRENLSYMRAIIYVSMTKTAGYIDIYMVHCKLTIDCIDTHRTGDA